MGMGSELQAVIGKMERALQPPAPLTPVVQPAAPDAPQSESQAQEAKVDTAPTPDDEDMDEAGPDVDDADLDDLVDALLPSAPGDTGEELESWKKQRAVLKANARVLPGMPGLVKRRRTKPGGKPRAEA